MEKNIYMYIIYIKLNHFATYLNPAQHCKLTILQKKMSLNTRQSGQQSLVA